MQASCPLEAWENPTLSESDKTHGKPKTCLRQDVASIGTLHPFAAAGNGIKTPRENEAWHKHIVHPLGALPIETNLLLILQDAGGCNHSPVDLNTWASVTSYYPCCYNWAWGHSCYSSSNYFNACFGFPSLVPSTSVPLDCFLGSVPVTSSLRDLSPFPPFPHWTAIATSDYLSIAPCMEAPTDTQWIPCVPESLSAPICSPLLRIIIFNYTPPSTSINSFLCLQGH